MRFETIFMRWLAWIIIAMLVMPAGLPAQDEGEPEQADRFVKEELVQMLAPIALYPDSLIAPILMASTYPLEVVEAERWLRQNRDLKGSELDNALLEKNWDPSVESLCHFPDILFSMSEHLDQTRKLGDAFLDQEDDVMATIQELRRRAEDQGNLRTTKEQQVIVEKEIITIVPADPEVVYVPVYDPFYVYGPWWYPAYPPYYWYYPSSVIVTGGYISFGPRVFIGIDLFSWTWFDWPFYRIYVDVNKTRRFHRYRDRPDVKRYVWRHEPRHRKGVAYRDRRTSERFGSRPPRDIPVSPETRGYPGKRTEGKYRKAAKAPIQPRKRAVVPPARKEADRSRETVTRRQGADMPTVTPGRERAVAPTARKEADRSRETVTRREGTGKPTVTPRRERAVAPTARKEADRSRETVTRREGTGKPAVTPGRERIQAPDRRDTPFSGVGSGKFERRASERGDKSRQSSDSGRKRRDNRDRGGAGDNDKNSGFKR